MMRLFCIPILLLAVLPTQERRASVAPLSGSALIDDLIQQKWKETNLAPTKPSEDAEFLRRVTLDITGTIPAADDALTFLRDKRADKRALKIDSLLTVPEYSRNWAEIW